MKKQLLIFLSFLTLSGALRSQPASVEYGSNKEAGRYIDIDGTGIYYETYGEGTTLLLLHGGLGSISAFSSSIPVLAKKYKVIAADSPGNGRSEHPGELSYASLAGTFSKFIDRIGTDSLYILGWSDGGVAALILAAERPDKVKKVIAVGANTTLDGLTEDVVKYITVDMADFAKSDATKEQALQQFGWWAAPYFQLNPQPDKWKSIFDMTQKKWATEVYIPREQLGKISIPVMIVQGDRDDIKIAHAEYLYRTIPHAQLCILPNTSHLVFEENAGLMCGVAMGFLE